MEYFKSDGNGNVVISMKFFVILPVIFTMFGGVLIGGLMFGSKFLQTDINTKNIETLTVKMDKLTDNVSGLTGYLKAKYGGE